ncbi:hypothetical protein GCM10011320_54750 [Neoroseomonas lacus]|uniref:Uncharacterized protein n=1 Tax=Neoroseomonas lacus TaxID=287609 RepID=A0A917L326_9PROT|nr:hypothetical protein GCM10011320_54750 [Neoroseomonas lacus]
MPSSRFAISRACTSSAPSTQNSGAAPGIQATAAKASPAASPATIPATEIPFGEAPRATSAAAIRCVTPKSRAAIGRRSDASTLSPLTIPRAAWPVAARTGRKAFGPHAIFLTCPPPRPSRPPGP